MIWLIVYGLCICIIYAIGTLAILSILITIEEAGMIILALSCDLCIMYFSISLATSTPSFLPITIMVKLDKTNYQKWKKTRIMNLIFMKLDMASEMDLPTKFTSEITYEAK